MRPSRAHVVILAGGPGTRFWPWSRRARPKLFLAPPGRPTLIAQTWRRARAIAPTSHVWIVAPASLAPALRSALPALRRDRLVIEPAPRDTAPALALAAERIRRVDGGAVMLVLPSDHVIDRPKSFASAARRALGAARAHGIVSLGVRPRGPASAYGYLVCDRAPGSTPARVVRFVEKPAPVRARRLLATGRSLWNTGAFAVGLPELVAELRRQQPAIATAAAAAADGRPSAWRKLAPISIDYAVLERARDRRAIVLRGGWDDLGSWDVAARLFGRGSRDAILIDAPGSAAFSSGRLVAVLGVPRAVVVDTPDAVLVVAREKAQEVRRVVAELRRRRRGDLE